MAKYPQELQYSKTHEWVRVEGEEITVGITDHAQHLLGELVFVELPRLQDKVENGDEVAVLESVKTAADVYSPLAGEVTAVNTDLQNNPNQVNQDPYGKGWLFKIKTVDIQQLSNLLDAEAYQSMIAAEVDS